ncbi:hypothetical protein N7532_006488 [Penicillium argentinense]|uniref:Rhodopsin domain-containing protein n=1 Tax=Penicillium argentinense TaxID=1131581 RepID=A0A9W9FGD2_9EURO|nr:uncharacterized protein N7532_006488 [Penicillium argentinense]KAJ5099487.1 hypothetical protein N7532_006488 [Penicillium argentinense]
MMSEDEHQRVLAVRTVAAVFMPIAVITVMLRCYVRGWVVKGFGLDDGSMVLAAVIHPFTLIRADTNPRTNGSQLYEHETAEHRVIAMRYWWLCEIAYCFASIFCKISICIFLMRITVKRHHIWTLYIVMILTVIAGLVFMFLMLLQCKPLSYFWTRLGTDAEGYCISIEIIIIMTYVYSVFAAVCDFTVGILPIFLVRNLHMKRQAKYAVVGILSMACIASSAVIIRLPFVQTFADYQFLYATYQIAIWSNIEAGLGITAGSLATLRPLLRKMMGSRSDGDYSSGFPRASTSRRAGASGQRPVPLDSLDGTGHSELRPDKLAVVVTNIESQRDVDNSWLQPSSPNSSEERLTNEPPTPGRMEVGIHRTFEVTTTADPYEGEGSHRMVKEHL